MKKKVISLKFRTAIVPQLKRIPSGTRVVRQLSCGNDKRIQYAIFSKNGTLLDIIYCNLKRDLRSRVLSVINSKLMQVNLFYGNSATLNQYKSAIS